MKKSRFPAPGGFTHTLHGRIDSYFTDNNKKQTGDYRLFIKSVIILSLLLGSYIVLYIVDTPRWGTVLSAVVLAQAIILVGFNIMHDGNHGSYSSSKKINKLAGYTLDLIGASSFLWKHKHNFLHHIYTNINGLDDDIETDGFIRLSPRQKWKPIQRFQLFYALPLYSIMTLNWFLRNDYRQFFSGKIGNSKFPGMSSGDKRVFIISKIFYYTYMVVIPLAFNSWQFVLTSFIVIHLMASFTISVIFQLAHTLELNEFPEAEQEGDHWENEWSVHQIRTTANFAHKNRLIAWYTGGLNHQIEHHLFPTMSHVHYPDISSITKEVCGDFGIIYNEYPSLVRAFLAHLKFLHKMGQNQQ